MRRAITMIYIPSTTVREMEPTLIHRGMTVIYTLRTHAYSSQTHDCGGNGECVGEGGRRTPYSRRSEGREVACCIIQPALYTTRCIIRPADDGHIFVRLVLAQVIRVSYCSVNITTANHY